MGLNKCVCHVNVYGLFDVNVKCLASVYLWYLQYAIYSFTIVLASWEARYIEHHLQKKRQKNFNEHNNMSENDLIYL